MRFSYPEMEMVASKDHKKTQGRNSRLSLYPMKFEEALKALLKVPPPPKEERNRKGTAADLGDGISGGCRE